MKVSARGSSTNRDNGRRGGDLLSALDAIRYITHVTIDYLTVRGLGLGGSYDNLRWLAGYAEMPPPPATTMFCPVM